MHQPEPKAVLSADLVARHAELESVVMPVPPARLAEPTAMARNHPGRGARVTAQRKSEKRGNHPVLPRPSETYACTQAKKWKGGGASSSCFRTEGSTPEWYEVEDAPAQ